MSRLTRSGLVWSLLFCLVLMNGSMAAPSVAHAAKHASHQAGTHSTGFCAWLCAAGQGIETVSVGDESSFRLIERVPDSGIDRYLLLFSPLVFLRGPPSIALS